MKKLLAVLLALALMPCLALADEDLSSMSTEELLTLRTSIDREIASRSGTADEQTITVNGVVFRLLTVEIGEARSSKRGLGVILLANNPGSSSMTPLYDLSVSATQDGVMLATSWVNNTEHFDSYTVSSSMDAVIRPGAVDMQVYLGFCLDHDGGLVELTLSQRHTSAGVDPYCGTFVIDLAAMQ